MFFWKSKKKIEQERIEEEQNRKISASQLALLEASITTADAASYVTAALKKHLEDSIKQFETTMKIIKDSLIVCDESGTILALNQATENIFATTSSNLLKKNIKILFSLYTEDFWHDVVKPTTKGLRQNGESFPIDVKLETMTKSDGSKLFLILIKDISEENKIKKTNIEIQHRYQILFNECIDGIVILQDNEIVASNKTAKDILNNTISLESIKLSAGEIVEVNGNSGTIEFVLSGADITWNDREASLINIKDIRGTKPLDASKSNNIDMIVCFDKNFKITFVNEPFSVYYNKQKSVLIGSDIRDIFNKTELATFLISVNSLSKECPMKRIQVHVEKNNGMVLQDWMDFAIYEDDELIEYQRTGKDITDILTNLKK
jgi:PAS domain S-box-containing protein